MANGTQKAKKPLEDRTVEVLEAIAALDYLPRYPKEDKSLQLIARTLAKFVETEEVTHSQLGRTVPLDWIVGEVAAHFNYFPAPIKWREMYQKHFEPLDGRSAYDMQALAED